MIFDSTLHWWFKRKKKGKWLGSATCHSNPACGPHQQQLRPLSQWWRIVHCVHCVHLDLREDVIPVRPGRPNPGDLRVKSSKKPSKHIPNSTSHRNGWYKVEPFKSLEVFFLGKHGETHVRSLVPDNQGSVAVNINGRMADWVLLGYIMQFNRQNIYTWAVMGSILPKMKWLNILQEVDFPTTQYHPASNIKTPSNKFRFRNAVGDPILWLRCSIKHNASNWRRTQTIHWASDHQATFTVGVRKPWTSLKARRW